MKKGDVRISYLVGGILFVVVLVVIIFGSWKLFGGQFNFFKYIGFGQGNKSVENIELLRYDIEDRSIEYYDGTDWINFENDGIAKLGEKTIDYNGVRSEFEEHFYNTERGEKVVELNRAARGILVLAGLNEEQIIEIIGESSPIVNAKSIWIIKPSSIRSGGESNGDVRFDLVDVSGSGSSKGNFYLGIGNKLRFRSPATLEYYNVDYENSELFSSIANAEIEWRDSVFEKPIALRTRLGPAVPKYFCAKLRDNRYIFVNLREEASKEGKCLI